MSKFPIPNNIDGQLNERISNIVEEVIDITKDYVLSKENHWLFKSNHLIIHKGTDLEESVDLYKQYWYNKFIKLHEKEEEINRLLIALFEMHEELIPNIKLEDLTILKDELDEKSLCKINKQLLRDSENKFKTTKRFLCPLSQKR